MRRGFLGVLVLVLACVAAPARAEVTYGSVTGISGVLYDDCLEYPYRYAVNTPADAGYRALTATLYEPDGRPSQVVTVYPDSNSETGTESFSLCTQVDLYGTYTIRATVEWGPDAEHPDESSATLADGHFTLRKPMSRTTLTASTRRPAYGQRVAFRIRAYDENPSGYLARAFTWVHLEKRRDGHWVRIRGSRAMTHDNGAVKVRVRYLKHHHRTMKVRAVTERTSRFTRSYSPVLRLW
jgi:hypothetical protein